MPAVRPGHLDLGIRHVGEAEMDPCRLAAGMAATNSDFALHHDTARGDLDPGADGIAIAAGLVELEVEPVASVRGCVAEDLCFVVAVDDHEIRQAVEVE